MVQAVAPRVQAPRVAAKSASMKVMGEFGARFLDPCADCCCIACIGGHGRSSRPSVCSCWRNRLPVHLFLAWGERCLRSRAFFVHM